jgi:hypothetical protein
MNIVKQTSTILKLQGKRRFAELLGVLFGTAFLLVGLEIIISWGNLTDLQCDRSAAKQIITCKITSSNLRRQYITPIAAGQLQGAEVQARKGSKSTTYGVVPITKSGKIPLTNIYSSGLGAKHQENSDKINRFISNPEQISLSIQQNDRWFAYPGGSVFALAGGVIIYSSLMAQSMLSCVFDKKADRVWLKQRSIIKAEAKEMTLSYIKEARVTKVKDKTYMMQLLLMSGEEVPLETSNNASKHYKVAESINKFIRT